MTKQKEIREGVADIVWKQVMILLGGDSEMLEEIDTSNFMYGKVAARKILDYLHSRGVVRRVDGDNVPDKCLCNLTEGRGYPNCGVVAVESLIVEENCIEEAP